MKTNTEHVSLLRAIASSDGYKSSFSRHDVLNELAAAGLVAWDGGSGTDDNGQWRQIRPPGHRITGAGQAALEFYELGVSIGRSGA